MALFDSNEKILAFVDTISTKANKKLLAESFNYVRYNYTSIFPLDNDLTNGAKAIMTLGMHYLWRNIKMSYRNNRLHSLNITDPNKSSQQVLLEILEGPGGTQISSFKFLFLKDLSERIYQAYNKSDLPAEFVPPSLWNYWAYRNSEDELTKEITDNLIKQIINTLNLGFAIAIKMLMPLNFIQ
jgi:hypothetical protein